MCKLNLFLASQYLFLVTYQVRLLAYRKLAWQYLAFYTGATAVMEH